MCKGIPTFVFAFSVSVSSNRRVKSEKNSGGRVRACVHVKV